MSEWLDEVYVFFLEASHIIMSLYSVNLLFVCGT